MFLAILIWVLKVPALLLLDLVTIVFSPIIALFTYKAEESEVTGFPSLHPGLKRDFLLPIFKGFGTPDCPSDEMYYGDYELQSTVVKYLRQYDYDTNWLVRYAYRILWLCRNPAYGFGHSLGYDSNDMTYLVARDNNELWGTKTSHSSFWKVTNPKGQIGWWYKMKWFYTADRAVVINIGYKLDADSKDGKKYVAMFFHPCRKFE